MDNEIMQVVMGLRPIDDDFMRLMFSDNKALVEYVLRVILDKQDLTVEKSETQYDLIIFGSKGLTLDVFATDSTGKKYNIEIQRSNSGAIPQRARYHSAALDVAALSKGMKISKLPDSYVIFITENDVIQDNCPTYIIERNILGSNKLFNDGSHIIYVNGAYNNTETAIGKLIHDFTCRSADSMLCQPMADVTYKYKNTQKGVELMCKAIEDYGLKQRQEGIQEGIREGRQEGIVESIKKFIKKGKLSHEEIAENFDVPVEEVRRLAAQAI